MSCENCEESAYVIDKLAKLLAEIAVIVNGPEPPLTRWSYHDLPEKVRALKEAPPAAAVPVQNHEPTRTGLAAQLYDSAQLSTLPGWCRDLLRKAADNEQELLPIIQRLTAELEARIAPVAVPEGYVLIELSEIEEVASLLRKAPAIAKGKDND